MKFAQPFSLNLKTATYAARALQIIFSVTIAAIFVRSLARAYWATPKAEIAVLLGFTVTSIIQSLAAAVLTYLCLDRIWIALLDLICMCGFVVTAVMTRGITADYGCSQWLSNSNDMEVMGMRRRDGHERGECAGLRGVFGISIVQCVLMLATFQMILFAVRAKRNHDLRVAAMTEKTWRADDTFARPVPV